MGNVTLSLSTAAQGVVGNATVNDMTLVPGNNTLPMTAIIDQDKVTKSMGADGMVELFILGTSSVYNGQHLTYYVSCVPGFGCAVLIINIGESFGCEQSYVADECYAGY